MPFINYSPLDNLEITGEASSKRYKKKTNTSQPHYGIDFRARTPLPVYNAHDGKVIYVGFSPSFGNVMIIQDASGSSTLYAHLSEFAQVTEQNTGVTRIIKVGDNIKGRIQIGLTGQTGGVPPHLHLEVINEEVSNLIAQGVDLGAPNIAGQGRINPRLEFEAAFPITFSTIVSAREDVFDFSGGNRDGDTLIGNSRPNVMQGLSGFDRYIASYGDTLSDVDRDGKIILNNRLLAGTMIPRKGVADQWISSDGKFLFAKVIERGNVNLWVMDANTPASQANNPATPHLTITNFPFRSDNPAPYGIALGKVPQAGQTEEVTKGTNIRSNGLYPNSNAEYFLAHSDYPPSNARVVGRFNPSGDLEQNVQLDEVEYDVTHPPFPFEATNNGTAQGTQMLVAYTTELGSVKKLARVDVNSGRVNATQTMGQEVGDSFFRAANTVPITSDGANFYYHFTQGSGSDSKYGVQQINPFTLEKIGNPELFSFPLPNNQPPEKFGPQFDPYQNFPAITLKGPFGNVTMQMDNAALKIVRPHLRAMELAEIPNQVIPNPGVNRLTKSAMINFPFQEAGQAPAIVSFAPTAGESAVYYVSGDLSNVRMDFSEFGDLTQAQILRGLVETDAQLSALDVLAQDPCSPIVRRDADDDYGYDDDIAAVTTPAPPTNQQASYLDIPQGNCNIRIFFSDIPKSDLISNLATVFTGYIAPTTTTTTKEQTSTTTEDPTTKLTSSATSTKQVTASPTSTKPGIAEKSTTTIATASSQTPTKQVTASPTSTTKTQSSFTTSQTPVPDITTTTNRQFTISTTTSRGITSDAPPPQAPKTEASKAGIAPELIAAPVASFATLLLAGLAFFRIRRDRRNEENARRERDLEAQRRAETEAATDADTEENSLPQQVTRETDLDEALTEQRRADQPSASAQPLKVKKFKKRSQVRLDSEEGAYSSEEENGTTI